MLKRSVKRAVWVKRPRKGHAGNAFETEGKLLEATVQPMSGTATVQMYGLQPSEMRLLLCQKCGEMRLGDGVCVEAAANAEPDFRVMYAAEWERHGVAHLRYIPEGERGADE